ncbi:MAG: hypothetical protein K0R28_3281 [Paenibacillus sp.]|nr:hypothetical protein [Paenibacillus sp.]
MKSTLSVIPCGAKKIWDLVPDAGSTPAKYAYAGAFHKACQNYAEAFSGQWVILSAKHGFLLPDDIVPGNYDLGFQHKDREIVTVEQLKRQLADKRLDRCPDVIVLGGRKLVRVLSEVLDPESCTVHLPLRDCKGIGYMLQRLNRAVELGQPM